MMISDCQKPFTICNTFSKHIHASHTSSSKVLAAAERNTRECIYRGQNSSEIWGGLPVVLLFGDDYQLMPVDKSGAINGYDKQCCGAEQHVTDKMTEAQLFAYRGDWLFTKVMTDQVYFLTKNYRVRCEHFKALLERVRKGDTTHDDATKLMKLHTVFHRNNSAFKKDVEDADHTMFLFSNNIEVRKKMWINLCKRQSQIRCLLQDLTAGTTQTSSKM